MAIARLLFLQYRTPTRRTQSPPVEYESLPNSIDRELLESTSEALANAWLRPE